jgi:trigger factor
VQVQVLSPAPNSFIFEALEAKINQHSAIEHELEIHIDESELKEAFDEAYREVRPKLSLPGFRPGKAPMGMVKKMHGDSIEGDALEKLAQEKFRIAAKENDIKPLGSPVMTDLHRHAGEGAHVKIAYEVAPEIELKDFAGMEVEKPVYVIADEDIDARIRRIRFAEAEQEPTEEIDDEERLVTLNLRELEPEAGKEPNNTDGVQAYLADPDVLPEIREALLGKKVGNVVEIELPKNPTNAQSSETAERGKVEVTVVAVSKVKLPELTEEYIKKISRDRASTEDELRATVREELEAAGIERGREEHDEAIVRGIIVRHEFLVPRTVTHAVLDQMIADFKERNRQRGYPEEFGLDEKAFRDRMWNVAEQRAKWSLLMEKLIEANHLQASDEDFDALAEKQAAEYGLSKENLLKFYQKDDRIRHQMETTKVTEWLRTQVTPKEKEIGRTTA